MPPWGLFGGNNARPSKCEMIDPDGKVKRLPSKITTSVPAGRVIVTETPGGGGWGDARQRDPDAVKRDVVEGIVDIDRAREVYGVSIKPGSFEIDKKKTLKLRTI